MSDVAIRGYRFEDCRALADLFTDTVRRIASRDYPQAEIEAWAPDPPEYSRFAPRLAGRPSYVAEIGQKIVGFSDLASDGYIDMMYVHADHQGQGVATALLAHIKAEAIRRHLRRLHTEASLTARPFFMRHGFSVLARRAVPLRGQLLTNFRMEKRLTTLD